MTEKDQSRPLAGLDLSASAQPLADRMRPRSLDEIVGQAELLAERAALRRALVEGHLHSMIFWGPPGSGKTTLARLVAQCWQADIRLLSAVSSGVQELRKVAEEATALVSAQGRRTVLFIDEVHRFNKVQQDVLLPHVESGILIFVGATTENPSFEVRPALLSRARVYVLKPLAEEELRVLLAKAAKDPERGLGGSGVVLQPKAAQLLAAAAHGDARRALNMLAAAAGLADKEITEKIAIQAVGDYVPVQFDKGGESFYDLISALHKSVRGSDPDASLFWMGRILAGGCDPLYVARRALRIASEDIGNADPRALTVALAAWDTYLRLGSPEGELAIAQAVIYLACAPKSNASYRAFGEAMDSARELGDKPPPKYLRNAPTKLMKALDYGKDYRYAHDEPGGYAAGVHYFPEGVEPREFYQPVERGLEIRIKERLATLRELAKKAAKKEK